MTQTSDQNKKNSLKKKEKLLKPVQYKYVYQQGKVYKGGEVWLYFCPNGLEYNRLGISISKKTCGSAVLRNRTKRLFREAFRQKKDTFARGRDLVYVIKKVPGLNLQNIGEIIEKLTGKNIKNHEKNNTLAD